MVAAGSLRALASQCVSGVAGRGGAAGGFARIGGVVASWEVGLRFRARGGRAILKVGAFVSGHKSQFRAGPGKHLASGGTKGMLRVREVGKSKMKVDLMATG